jgi:Fis family transcriptional regulator
MNVNDVDNCMDRVINTASPDQPLLLSEHVRLAVKDYVTRLDGEDIGNLYGMVLTEVERPLIQTVLELCGQNQSKASQMLGLSRSTLRKKMAIYGPT